jgi:hypothetical protein
MYSLKYIPTRKKKKIEEAFLEHIDWIEQYKRCSSEVKAQIKEKFMNAIAFMYSVDIGYKHSTEFKITTESLDNLRNENFWDVFPEHADMKEFIYGSDSL